jgi:tetrahydromethanopterin S-methyltransferase subunit B
MGYQMAMTLAQVTMPTEEFPPLAAVPNIPSRDDIVRILGELSRSEYGWVMAAVLVACGLVYMLHGWKIFKILVIVNAGLLGAVVGGQAGSMLGGHNTWLYMGIAGGLLLAVLAGPLMKYAVSLMGGLAGSFMGYSMWHYVVAMVGQEDLSKYAWVGALIGLITLGLLAFIILQAVVTIITSVQGTVMTISGLVVIVMTCFPTISCTLEESLRRNNHLVALLIAVPAIIGVAFQYSLTGGKGKKKAPEGG